MYELDARYVAGRRGRGRNKSPLSRMEPHRIRPATRLRRRNLTYRGQVLFRERAAGGHRLGPKAAGVGDFAGLVFDRDRFGALRPLSLSPVPFGQAQIIARARNGFSEIPTAIPARQFEQIAAAAVAARLGEIGPA